MKRRIFQFWWRKYLLFPCLIFPFWLWMITARMVPDQIAEDLGKTIQRPRSGFTSCWKNGFWNCIHPGICQIAIKNGAEAVGQMDADFSHPPEKVVELVKTLESCDMALGSRYVPGGKLDERWPFWRKALSGFGNFYARTILGLKLRDVTGGFRLWKSSTLSGHATGPNSLQWVHLPGGNGLCGYEIGFPL